MKTRRLTGSKIRGAVAALVGCGALALASAPAQAQVPGFNFYIGGGIGQSDVDLDDIDIDFDSKDTAWKAFAGVRIASIFGAELQYFDFGSPGGGGESVDYKGLGGYGLVYLPLPLPILDVYAKAGVAKVDVDIDTGDFNTDDTQFSYGVGVQLKFSSWALRGEYERFKVDDNDLDINAKPSLLSVSFSKSFL